MYRLSSPLISNLSRFAQRKLEKGEIFLLAKVIADHLPLAPQDTDNIALYTLTHRRFVDDVIFSLNDYTHLNEETRSVIYKLINEQVMWRKLVAYTPPRIVFRGEPCNVVDDVSCLLNFTDLTYICSVGDIIDNANWVYNMFCDLAKEVKAQQDHRDAKEND